MSDLQEMMSSLYRSGEEFGTSLIPASMNDNKAREFIWRVNDMLEEYGLEWRPYQEAIYITDGNTLEDVERLLPEGPDFTDLFLGEIIPEAAFAADGVIIHDASDQD